MLVKEANLNTGHKSGLGRTSKMPGYSTALSAHNCHMGAKLHEVEGTICSDCYAMKGNYQFPDVKKGHQRRLAAISNPLWVGSMAFLVNLRCKSDDPDLGYFRWFDSGDLQSVEHLVKIVAVARKTPGVKHWLATRELSMLLRYQKLVNSGLQHVPPANLTVRVSSTMLGQKPLLSLPPWAVTSTVDWVNADHTCPARMQGNSCGSCRRCWDSKVPNVNYPKH